MRLKPRGILRLGLQAGLRWLLISSGLVWAAGDGMLQLEGSIGAAAIQASGPQSWLRGGYGKLESGNQNLSGFGQLQLGLKWEPWVSFSFQLHAVGRVDEDENAGITEAFFRWNFSLSSQNEFRLKFGQFFPPTSLENTEPLWQARGTAHFSGINSWIGEELRSQGLDLSVVHELGNDWIGFAGGSALLGNDTTGALLAWRGWALGNQLTTFNQVLPLPPLTSLRDEQAFQFQRDDGSKPFGRDLDQRLGWSGRAGVEWIGHLLLQVSHFDNRADRGLHRAEYAWHTRFNQAGLHFEGPFYALAAEWLEGETGMGLHPPYVDASFRSWYLRNQFEWQRDWGSWLLTQRFEELATNDQDHLTALANADWNQESGHALTVALGLERGPWRIVLEWLKLRQERRFLESDMGPENENTSAWTLEMKRLF